VFDSGGDPPEPTAPSSPSVSQWELVKTNNERRNLVLRRVKEYIQIQ
jgi:hypothetical protein